MNRSVEAKPGKITCPHCGAKGTIKGSPPKKKPVKEGKKETILFNLSGHGLLDLSAYEQYFSGALHDYEYPAEAIAESMKHLPQL